MPVGVPNTTIVSSHQLALHQSTMLSIFCLLPTFHILGSKLGHGQYEKVNFIHY